MQFQHGRDSHPRSDSWKRTNQDGTGKDKGSKRMEDTDKDQGCQEFPRICQLLQTIHSQLQSYGKTIERIKGQKGVEIGKGTPGSIRGTQEKDHKSTSTSFTQERRKIQSGDGRIRTCHWRSTFPRARREMETHCVFIKDNATSRKELQDLRQGTIGNCRSLGKMETISTGRSGNIRNLDRPQESEIFPRTSQIKWTTSKMVLEIAGLRFCFTTYPWEDKHKSRHSFKKGPSGYKRRQQGRTTPER